VDAPLQDLARRAKTPARPASLRQRLLNLRVADLLARNTLVSTGAFLFDLMLLWLFIDRFAMNMMAAAVVAFLIATSIHYVFCRIWIFRGSDRALAAGYAYFLVNAGIGLVLTMTSFAALVFIGVHYLAARIIASVVAGLTVFLLNATLNFRSV
jgi:putative flippase GtrA